MTKISISLSEAFMNKDIVEGYTNQAFSNSFIPQALTPHGVFQHVINGKALVLGTYNGGRKEDNFIQAQFLLTDHDDNISIADCIKNQFVIDNAYGLYPTASSGKLDDNGNPIYKTRILFLLDKSVTDSPTLKRYIQAIHSQIKELKPDDAPTSSAQIFFGSNNRIEDPIELKKVSSTALLDNLAIELNIEIEQRRTDSMNEIIRASNKNIGTMDSHEVFANDELNKRIDAIRNAQKTTGHETIRSAASYIGTLVGANLSYGVAESSLVSAAVGRGKSQSEAQRVVSSGLAWGMARPKDWVELIFQKEKKKSVDKQFKERKVELKTKPVLDKKKPELSDIKLYPAAYESWVSTRYLPLGWVRALLTLSDSRSAVTTIAIKLHDAFRTGLINSECFTMKEVYTTLKTAEKSTKAALKTFIAWGFMSDSDTYSIYTSKANYPTHNSKGGRPSKNHAIVTDTEMLNLELLERLDFYILESYTSKSVAPRIYTMMRDLDLSSDESKQWHNRGELLLDSDVKYKIARDRKHWKESLSEKSWHSTIAYDSTCTNLELRSRILKNHIARYDKKKDGTGGIQMSQDELMCLLGLKSANSFKSIYKLAGLKSEKVVKWSEVISPNDCDLPQEIIDASKATKERRGGVVIALNLKVKGATSWLKGLAYGDKMFEVFNRHNGIIDKMHLRVQLPSLIRFKTKEEIELQEIVIKAEQEQLEIEAATESVSADVAPTVIETTPTKTRRKKSYSTKQDRDWNSHDKAWIHEQLQVEMYSWLNQKLTASGHVLDADNQLVKMLTSDSDIIRYINKHAENKPINTINDFYEGAILSKQSEEKEQDSVVRSDRTTEKPIAPRQVKTKKRYMTLAETRAWGLADDKVEYLQSIGIK